MTAEERAVVSARRGGVGAVGGNESAERTPAPFDFATAPVDRSGVTMGIEFVELVMSLEESFGIELPKDELAGLSTVGDLHECVLRRLESRLGPGGQLADALERLRGPLAEAAGVPAEHVAAATPLSELFPRGVRPGTWRRIQRRLGLRLPPPVGLTPRLKRSAALAAGALAASLWAYFDWLGVGDYALLAVLVMLVAWLVLMFAPGGALLPLRMFPATVGALAEGVLAANAAKLLTTGTTIDRAAVWSVLRHVVADVFIISPERVRPETRFVEDLRA